MRIGEVAARSGVSPRALRYYEEEQQLLPAERSASGQRHYTDIAVERVRLIQQLYAAGLGSKAIVELLPCVHTGIATPAMLTRMAFERDRIDHQVRELTQTRNRLDEILGSRATRRAMRGSRCSADVRVRRVSIVRVRHVRARAGVRSSALGGHAIAKKGGPRQMPGPPLRIACSRVRRFGA